MTQFRFSDFDAGGVTLHNASCGKSEHLLIVCLHGFPEFWIAWREVMRELAHDFHLVAPDQRGFGLSSKPAGKESYRARNMVDDLAALADHLSPDTPFVLAGHDWGASVAYAYAFAHPGRLSHLIIANGAHPVCFQRAILRDAGQRRASQYFHKLRAPGAAERMAADDFGRTMTMIEGFSTVAWMTPQIAAEYRAAWSQPGAMQAMLNWYDSSPVVVPGPDEMVAHAPLLDVPRERVTVSAPHLVLWGAEDQALRPACLEELEEFVPDLTVRTIPGASHWILHEKPGEVASEIRRFVGC